MKRKKSKSKKPFTKGWKNKNGRRLALEKVRAVARTWDRKNWGDYLDALEGRLWVELVDNFDAVLSKYEQDEANRAGLDETARVEREKLCERLELAIEELPPSERALIQAVYWDGLSIRSCAEAFKLDPRTISKRLKRSIVLLRQKMCITAPPNRGVPFSTEESEIENHKDNEIREVYAELTGMSPY